MKTIAITAATALAASTLLLAPAAGAATTPVIDADTTGWFCTWCAARAASRSGKAGRRVSAPDVAALGRLREGHRQADHHAQPAVHAHLPVPLRPLQRPGLVAPRDHPPGPRGLHPHALDLRARWSRPEHAAGPGRLLGLLDTRGRKLSLSGDRTKPHDHESPTTTGEHHEEAHHHHHSHCRRPGSRRVRERPRHHRHDRRQPPAPRPRPRAPPTPPSPRPWPAPAPPPVVSPPRRTRSTASRPPRCSPASTAKARRGRPTSKPASSRKATASPRGRTRPIWPTFAGRGGARARVRGPRVSGGRDGPGDPGLHQICADAQPDDQPALRLSPVPKYNSETKENKR